MKKAKDDKATAAWLEAKVHPFGAYRLIGIRRVERLTWTRLAAIYTDAKPGSKTRRLINAEARRCGYAPSTILGFNDAKARV